jgi:hypothetical protein
MQQCPADVTIRFGHFAAANHHRVAYHSTGRVDPVKKYGMPSPAPGADAL